MAITVAYKNSAGADKGVEVIATNALAFHLAIYNWMVANAAFTIIATSASETPSVAVGAEGGWFVYSMVGAPWQAWMGCYIGPAFTGWHTGNSRSGAAWVSTDYLWSSFAPGGGWKTTAVADTPKTLGAMFTLAPARSGGHSKIQSHTGTLNASANKTATFIYDPATYFFCMLVTESSDTAWANGMLITNVTNSTVTAIDTYPWVMFGGALDCWDTTTSSWSGYNASPTLDSSYGAGFCLAPTLASTAQHAGMSIDGKVTLNNVVEPNPLSGEYDWQQVLIRNNMTGERHFRGGLNTSHIRITYPTLAGRQLLGAGTWVVLDASQRGFIVPWDNTAL